jgi:alkanesulfonate monooxygenase SsuD/methylene tetrahydromethanopterin reductase-like flavin-dependent oxidoreductase (luciferase family)
MVTTRVRVGFKTAPRYVDWPAVDAIWASAVALDTFDSGWTFDHFYPADGVGPTFEGWTTLALLSHHVPGMDVGHLVLANPYRHPALVAKMATTMDHATQGHFILGLGAGWLEAEANAYGMPLAPIPDRLRDLEAAIQLIQALFRDPAAAEWPDTEADAATSGGVSVDAPPYRLMHARADPMPLTPGGPPLWLGVQGEKVGMRLVAQYADGWNYSSGPIPEFLSKRDALMRHCEKLGRDPGAITISTQIRIADARNWREALEEARQFVEVGCDYIILYLDARDGPEGLELLAREVARPLKEMTVGSTS